MNDKSIGKRRYSFRREEIQKALSAIDLVSEAPFWSALNELPEPQYDETDDFAFRMGYVLGASKNKDMRAWLIGCGLSEAEIDAFHDAALVIVKKVFYGKEST